MGTSTARKDVALDVQTHDLVLVNGDFTFTSGAAGVAQDIKIAILMHKGEVFYDQSEGVPWFERPGVVSSDEAILGSRPDPGVVEGILAAIILARPDVAKLNTITASLDRNRALTVAWTVTTGFGDLISDTLTLTR